jgi:hypothetical protein
MPKGLFLGTENACRGQMAEGLVNHDLAGEKFDLVITVCAQAQKLGVRRLRDSRCPVEAGAATLVSRAFSAIVAYGKLILTRLRGLVAPRRQRHRHVAGPNR